MTTMTMPVDKRVLYAEHPEFGVADPDKGVHIIRTNHGPVYIGGYWGGWDTYANLPAEEVTITESWYCAWSMGMNVDCGDPATEVRGFDVPYCPKHAHTWDVSVEWYAVLADDDEDTVAEVTRHAVVTNAGPDRLDTIRRYLPSNYTADSDGGQVFIHGVDQAGWTLDDYVIPRLASGLWYAKEMA